MSFFDAYGREITIEDIRDRLIAYYQETGTAIDDFEEGSEIMNLFTAFAYCIYDIEEAIDDIRIQTNVETADGENLDTLAEQPNINLSRITGAEAEGSVLFRIPEALTEEFLIPQETALTSGDMDFELLDDVVIPAGETEGEGNVVAMEEGIKGNIEANSIGLTEPTELFTVTNTYAFKNGADYEEDPDFRARILAYLQESNFGSAPYLIDQINQLGLDDLHDIVIEPCNCDYSGIIYPNTYNSEKQEEINQEIQAFVDTPANVIAGQTFTVQTPVEEVVTIYVGYEYDTNWDYVIRLESYITSDQIQKIAEIIDKYCIGGTVDGIGAPLEFPGLNIGEEFDYTILYNTIKTFTGAENPALTRTSDDADVWTIPLNDAKKYDVQIKINI